MPCSSTGRLKAALLHEPSLPATFRKHTGLYVYRRDVLLDFAGLAAIALERQESLEQLRALENGVEILAVEACSASIGVDTKVDLERVRQIVSGSEFRVPGVKVLSRA